MAGDDRNPALAGGSLIAAGGRSSPHSDGDRLGARRRLPLPRCWKPSAARRAGGHKIDPPTVPSRMTRVRSATWWPPFEDNTTFNTFSSSTRLDR